MMKPIRMAVALSAAAMLLGGLAAPAFATALGSGVPATAGITAGDRTANLAGPIAFPAVSADHNIQSATDQPASIEVDDLTGTDAGWDVTLVASDLAGPNGGTIAAGNLSVAGYGGLASVSGATTGIQPGNTGSIGSATTLLSGPPGPVRATTSKRSTWV